MTTIKHPNHGSSLEDFLREDGNLDAATAIAVKRVIAWQLQQEMEKQKLTKSAMAKLMQTSRVQLDRVLSPDDGNVTLETLQRAARAVGKELRLELA
ncbi:helix-turn-helix domain-containing protein [Prosthecomicrobium hirschii]|uniref:helix-turn-helix domain-containing protein n=1 Tax=Prosthecodimorpha hirschii TaxID=665126 RepID=UPI002220663E|nr:helix-turn-helix domain-containing protein [Prosthecomicrobium hirschii]MCW1839771.1 helix-turn-helix domain-containing protein [Prosthecomicrobium hirschii]